MRHPRGAQRTLNSISAFSVGVLGLKGTNPSSVLPGIKGLLSQWLKASRWQHDLVNPLKDRSHLLPLLVRHPRQAALPRDPRVDDHGPLREHGPQRPTAGTNWSHDRCDPLIVEIARNQTAWFVERSRRDFEQIGRSPLAHRTIHPGVVIMSERKKPKRDEA